MEKLLNNNYHFDDVETNEFLLRRTGLLAEGSWSIHNYIAIVILLTGVLHYFGKICFELEVLDLLGLMKTIHLTVIYFFVGASSYSILSDSEVFLEMQTIIKAGFKFYKTPYSEEQICIMRETNRRIIRNTKIFIFIFVSALFSTILREELPVDFEEWSRKYSGWFPIKINSWPRYIGTQIYHATIAITLDACSCTFFIVFVTFADHICAQIKILIIAVTDAFDPMKNSMDNKNDEVILKEHIISCIKHQIEILRFINKLQKYYNGVLINTLTGASVVLCTMAYMLTDPNTSHSNVIAFLALGIPEVSVSMFYCIYGQKITNLTEKLKFTIYNNTYWYSQPLEIQYYILMMLTRATKTVTLTAGGLTNCNLDGYKDIVQGTWAYFNMLRAFRGKD